MKLRFAETEAVNTGRHILGSLAKTLRHAELTDLERTRCLREIELVLRRLSTREYRQSSFVERNLLSIPDRTDEICKDLRFFWSVGAIWKEIFDQIGLENSESILDIGCGFFPKVELGLYYKHFCGQVTLMDPCLEALKQAHQFLKFFQVDFKVARKVASIWEPSSQRYDLIVANHVLDDLFLDTAARQRGFETIDAYKSEQLFSELWASITAQPELGTELMDKFAEVLGQSLNPGGRVVLLDYPSFSHRAMGLISISRYVSRCQAELRTFLSARGITPFKVLESGKLRRERLIIKASNVLCARRTE